VHLTPLPAVTLSDLVAVNEASLSRTAGCHVSDIVREIMLKIDPKRYSKDYGEASDNWQQAGFIWEDVLSLVFAQRANTGTDTAARLRPGELTLDGIIGSPDALCYEDELYVPADPKTGAAAYTVQDVCLVEEYKCTWKSANNFDLYDKRFLWWLLQMQAYCKLAGTRFARLYVFHVNGNYDSFIPQCTQWLLVFSQRELDEQWVSLCNTARSKGWIS
jgi:hypothetical protein